MRPMDQPFHGQKRRTFRSLPTFPQEHVSYVSAQVRGHSRLPAVGKVDEIHNISLATRAGAEVSDTLKYFAERLPATFVYAGLDVDETGLFAGTRGRQIAGRFTLIPARPFDYGTKGQKETWRSLIAAMEASLRRHNHQAGTLTGLGKYLFGRTGGMIGSLSQLVRGAAILAIEGGSEQITQDLLDLVPVDHAAQRSSTRRPARRART